ncbi:hypothetical protein B0H15DRAFT_942024 [Mycena belliarum]|uniref:Uncharacterized protein n=1 Tax=Mycena belliarum TaxID=1033014 RepID=A0AAD6UMH2_9AGAR|nr:hypothetical protein B0H15DRAFT_942024 [Mycena belliae]
MKSKYTAPGPTKHKLSVERKRERNEKARLRMARCVPLILSRREELKTRSREEQDLAAARAKAHQATYREKNRSLLRFWEAERRVRLYQSRYGHEAYEAYAEARRRSKARCRLAKAAKEPYSKVTACPIPTESD